MNIKPIGDKIFVQPINVEDNKTVSGIILPERAQNCVQVGIVKTAGTGRILESGKVMPLEVKAGDKIIYRQFAGTEVKLSSSEEPLLLMTERDVYCIIGEEA